MKLFCTQNSALMLERTRGETWSAHFKRVPHHLSHFLLRRLLPPVRGAHYFQSAQWEKRHWAYLHWHMDTSHPRELRKTTLIFILFEQIFFLCGKRLDVQKNKCWKCSGLGYEFHILVWKELLKFLGKGILWDVMSCLETCLRSIEWSATSRSNYGPECHTGYGIIMQWNQ